MSRNCPNLNETNHNNGDHIMPSCAILQLTTRSVANQAQGVSQMPATKAIVRRGPQLMVVFQNCPKAAVVEALLSTGVEVGLALAPRDFSKVSRLDNYSYVFTGMGRKGSSPLKQAVADLAHNGWTIDDDDASDLYQVEPRAPRAPVRTHELALAQA